MYLGNGPDILVQPVSMDLIPSTPIPNHLRQRPLPAPRQLDPELYRPTLSQLTEDLECFLNNMRGGRVG